MREVHLANWLVVMFGKFDDASFLKAITAVLAVANDGVVKHDLQQALMIPAARRSKLHKTSEAMLMLQMQREEALDPECGIPPGIQVEAILEQVELSSKAELMIQGEGTPAVWRSLKARTRLISMKELAEEALWRFFRRFEYTRRKLTQLYSRQGYKKIDHLTWPPPNPEACLAAEKVIERALTAAGELEFDVSLEREIRETHLKELEQAYRERGRSNNHNEELRLD